MGGTLAVVIRRKGIVYPMHRWTNTIKALVEHVGFINNDDAHFEEYLNAYRELSADWLENKDKQPDAQGSIPYKFPMTNAYAPYPALLAPCGYGIVVIDADNKVLLSSQGYCEFGTLHNLYLPMPSTAPKLPPDFEEAPFMKSLRQLPPDTCIQDLHAAGRIVGYYGYGQVGPVATKIGKDISLDQISTFFYESRTNKDVRWEGVLIDHSPWKIEDYGESDDGLYHVWNRLSELGFEISKEAEDEWHAFRKNRFGEDAED